MENVTPRYSPAGRTSSAIATDLEAAVRDGRLAPGEALPTVRALAGDLDVSPATVAAAYRTLRQRGVVETAGRRGTRVRDRSAVTPPRSADAMPVPPGARDLSTGMPDPALLPTLPAVTPDADGYERIEPDLLCLPEMAVAGRARLAASGVPVDRVTVTFGALDGIERCLSAYLRPGDRVAVEDPGWASLLDLVPVLGLEPVPVAVDEFGPRTDALRAALAAGAKAVVLTARAHNPTGASITADRATALRTVLAAHPGTLVVEDDHAAELAGVPLRPVAGCTPRWAHLRSTNKPYHPDLRFALLAGDEETVARVAGRIRIGAGWVSTLVQRLVLGLWADPAATEAVRRAAAVYDDRRTALLASLRGYGLPAYGRTGLNVWVRVPNETGAVTRLLEAGWVVAPGARFRMAGPTGIRITVSTLAATEVAPLARAVAAAAAPSIGRGARGA
jgi:DNA-binding transcriptional MocR family regulator